MPAKKVGKDVVNKKATTPSKKVDSKTTNKPKIVKKDVTSKKEVVKKKDENKNTKPKKIVRAFIDPTISDKPINETPKEIKPIVEEKPIEEVKPIVEEKPIINDEQVTPTKQEEVSQNNDDTPIQEVKEEKPTEGLNNNEVDEKKKKSHAEKIRALKFFLVSISAGIIQLGSTALLAFILEKCGQKTIAPAVSASVGLVLSVIWNFTFNRKFTFKSAVSIPKAMSLAFLFYVFFFPAQLFATAFLTNGDVWGLLTIYHVGSDGVGWTILATVVCMVFNLILEFIWQKFVVFRGSIDTNNNAVK